jgi:hypothetical protein
MQVYRHFTAAQIPDGQPLPLIDFYWRASWFDDKPPPVTSERIKLPPWSLIVYTPIWTLALREWSGKTVESIYADKPTVDVEPNDKVTCIGYGSARSHTYTRGDSL